MSMPIEAKGAEVVSMGCFSGCCGVVFADYPRGGSSRSIPLADGPAWAADVCFQAKGGLRRMGGNP
jgi:hypothetical protein